MQAHHSVLVYHDETGNAGPGGLKGHVLFWVPIRISATIRTPLFGTETVVYKPEQLLFDRLLQIRSAGFNRRFHFTEISGRRWSKSDLPYLEAVTLAVDALRQKRSQYFERPLCCKLAVLFYPKKSDLSLYGGSDGRERYQRHDETVLRMLLKGAAHYLYGNDVKVSISGIVSDGQPKHRPLDPYRVVFRMLTDEDGRRTPLREYVTFSQKASITHVSSNHREHAPGSVEYRHAHHLQLADLLLGSVIRACCEDSRPCEPPPVGHTVGSKKDIVATPVRTMLDKARLSLLTLFGRPLLI